MIIRKGLEYIFSQPELSFLDDVIPESQKTQKENEDKKIQDEMDEVCNNVILTQLKSNDLFESLQTRLIHYHTLV